MSELTFEQIRNNKVILDYINQADKSLKAMGFTEHGLGHVSKVSKMAGDILEKLGYDAHTVEMTRIAGFMHDIGNVVNRIDHAQSGAIMSFRILDELGMSSKDIATVISAIGNHDESTAYPVNEVAAALIIADKSDVRRSRVRKGSELEQDIHDRVNYSVTDSETELDLEKKQFILKLTIDTNLSPVIEYFEIFMQRMMLCQKAADKLELQFKLVINGSVLI